MSVQSSGSEYTNETFFFPVEDSSQVGEVRRFASQLCFQLDFQETRQGRVSIVVNELGNNLVRYARGGTILLRKIDPAGVEILAIDRGPGLDEGVVMQDGYSTGVTPGTGLGAIRRQSDEFDLYSYPEQGTLIVSRIYGTDQFSKIQTSYEIGAVHLPLRGETVCGDGWSVRQSGENLESIVVDGLGHGPSAHQAALEAVEVFQNSQTSGVAQTLHLIHGRLKSTRGGAVFLMNAQPGGVDFTGVGNIRALIQSPTEAKTLISQNGTAGLQIRNVIARREKWDGEGYLILHSDGINSRWDLTKYLGLQRKHPSIVAGLIYRDFCRGNDDATVVVIRRAY